MSKLIVNINENQLDFSGLNPSKYTYYTLIFSVFYLISFIYSHLSISNNTETTDETTNTGSLFETIITGTIVVYIYFICYCVYLNYRKNINHPLKIQFLMFLLLSRYGIMILNIRLNSVYNNNKIIGDICLAIIFIILYIYLLSTSETAVRKYLNYYVENRKLYMMNLSKFEINSACGIINEICNSKIDEYCPICMNNYVERDIVLMHEKCRTMVHLDCVKEWNRGCIVCRDPIYYRR
jgi:hypothetical protein